MLSLLWLLSISSLFQITFSKSPFPYTITSAHSFPSTELTALYDLYNATNGQSWQWKDIQTYGAIWNFTQANPNPCTQLWQGIECTSDCTSPCNVESLVLSGYGLDGTLPTTISELTSLITLNISGNPLLAGNIPISLTSLTSLQRLDLSSNRFDGPIPNNLGNLLSLQVLSLQQNFFSSTIPYSLTSLKTITILQLQENYLDGSLPISSPEDRHSIFWPMLTVLNVASNYLTDGLTDAFCTLKSLQKVNLSRNRFDGELPHCIGNLSHIETFDISLNVFYGNFPKNISQWQLLTSLEIQKNDFTGDLPKSIGDLKHLTLLNASRNGFGGILPNSFQSLTNLQQLDLSQNLFSGNLSMILNDMPQLSIVQLQFNLFHGRFDDVDDKSSLLHNVQYLDLTQNFIEGPLPSMSFLLHRPKLQVLLLSSNKLMGTIPWDFTNTSESIILTTLHLTNNQLDGTIPNSLLMLSHLESIALDYNFLNGTLPDCTWNDDENNSSSTTTTTSNSNVTSPLQYIAMDYNYLSGSIPTCWGKQFPNVTYFSMEHNSLTGTLPPQLGNMKKLQTFHLTRNSLRGSLPNTFQALSALESFDISNNYFNGTIPDIWSSFHVLTFLNLEYNHFSGTIPSSIGMLVEITQLLLANNALTGTLSNTIFTSFKNIQQIDLGGNRLAGSLPSSLYNLFSLFVFGGNNNFFSGTLEDHFQSMPLLTQLLLNNNLLEGTLPSTLRFCTLLDVLDTSWNSMEGVIPDSYFVRFPAMQSFVVSYNQLSGNITNGQLIDWSKLQRFEIASNYLTGTIPSTLFAIRSVKSLYLQFNLFHGPWLIEAPTHLGNASVLTNVNLYGNMLTNTIPTNLQQFNLLDSLNISNNFFTGTLPREIMQSLSNLENVGLANNRFHGNLEEVFSNASRLHLLFAENNQFSGKFQNIFNPQRQSYIFYVDLSNNKISGSIPAEFAIAQNLSSLALVKNCMTGSIPEELCTNRFMQSLALDGLHTADACQTKLFSWLPSYVLRDAIRGTIPSCLFEMEKLRTLHLSGNNIGGSLPKDGEIVLSDELVDLSLSNNLLTGTIPSVIQSHFWTSLDLSFNKFNGKLLSSMSSFDETNQSLTLDVNRLSGKLPASLKNAYDINILDGNLFSCDLGDRSKELPRRDSDYESYQCGSNKINVPMFMWVFVIGMIVLCYLLIQKKLGTLAIELIDKIWNDVQVWWSVFDSSNVGLNTFATDLVLLRQLCASWTLIVAIILIPLYVCFTVYFGTHEYEYAWVVSLAYKSGRLPAGIAFAILFIILCWVEYNIQFIYNKFLGISSDGIHKSAKRLNSDVVKSSDSRRVSRRLYLSKRSAQSIDGNSNITAEILSEETPVREILKEQEEAPTSTSLSGSFAASASRQNSTASGTASESNQSSRSISIWDSFAKFGKRLSDRSDSQTNMSSEVKKDIGQDYRWQKWKWILWSMFLIILNVIFVFSINGAYVYAVTTSLNPIYIGLVTLQVTLFKVGWSVLIIAGYFCTIFDYTLDLVCKDLWIQTEEKISKYTSELSQLTQNADTLEKLEKGQRHIQSLITKEKQRFFQLQSRYDAIVSRVLIVLSLFNNVVAPLLAVLLVRPECFYYLIVEPSSISVSYKFLQCEYGFIETPSGFYDCAGKNIGTHTASYVPAFNYSYQCSSSLLASFIDVYLYRYLISGIVLPIIFLLIKRYQESLYQQYCDPSTNEENRMKIEKWLKFLSSILPIPARMVVRTSPTKVPDPVREEARSTTANPLLSLATLPHDVERSESYSSNLESVATLSMTSSIENSESKEDKVEEPFGTKAFLELIAMPVKDINQTFVARKFSTLLVGDLVILLTFGTIFPPLAIVIFISVVMHTLLTQLTIGRFITLSLNWKEEFIDYVEVVKRETATVGSLIALAIAPITGLASLFWSFFLFDIMGDEVGTSKSYWILLVMPMILIVSRSIWFLIRRYNVLPYLKSRFFPSTDKKIEETGERFTIELSRPTETGSFFQKDSKRIPSLALSVKTIISEEHEDVHRRESDKSYVSI